MKHFVSIPVLLASLCLALPTTGLSKDKHKHKHHHHKDRCDSNHRSHHSHSHHRSSLSFYRNSYPSSYGYGYSRPYAYNYPSYSYPIYSSYSYSSAPTFGLSLSTSPSYYRAVSRVNNYDDDLAVDVQRALRQQGYYGGGIDGDIGPRTRAAIREYQYDHRLEVTGRIDRSLLRSLGVS